MAANRAQRHRGNMDDGERISRLSEGQKQCLRLVSQLKTSKEIARDLDISPHTVDQRIKVAIRTLGVESRAEAARLLGESEAEQAGTSYQGLVYPSPDIAGHAGKAAHRAQDDGVDADPPVAQGSAHEELAAGSGLEGEAEPPRSRGHNDLNAWQRLAVILAIAFGSALAFGAILAGLDALSRLS